MKLDLEKLDRLEERAETLNEALRSLFGRYRARVNSAQVKRQQALIGKQASFAHMSLAQLAEVAPAELQAAGVNVAILSEAFRDMRAAEELMAEHRRQAAAQQDAVGLLHSLRKFAGREQ